MKQRLLHLVVVAAFPVVLLAGAQYPAAALSAGVRQPARSAAAGSWTTMRLPAAVGQPAVLNGIAAASRDLAWAVGTETVSATGRPLLLHWNGRHWIKDAVPGAPQSGQVVQVSSAARDTAWALGYLGTGAPFIVRWLGPGWIRVPVPGDLKGQTVYSIAGGTGGSAWLWGFSASDGYLLEHWSKGSWQAIKVPSDLWGTSADMHALGPNDLWVNDFLGSGNGVVARYHAGTWSATAPQAGGVSLIAGILPVAPSSAWIAVFFCTAFQPGLGCTSGQPELAHWNGSAWNRIVRPKGISDATSISPGRTGRPQWAGISASGQNEPLFYEHFDGKRWTLLRVRALQPGATSTSTVVAAVPRTNATWAIASSHAAPSSPGITVIQYNPGQ